jgi:NAD(P)-dependent dehydrogenase (short-subunit alcohol dehydrogenase family)
MDLKGKSVLITGGAVRIGRAISLFLANKGANIVLHYRNSAEAALQSKEEIEKIGVDCRLVQADLSKTDDAKGLIEQIENDQPLFGLVNSASIFKNLDINNTELSDWQQHLDVNLTAPFLISQALFKAIKGRKSEGRIVNLLDWRAEKPGADHLPYTISKAGLAGLTRSLGIAMAPRVSVNGIALGAVLPPIDGADTSNILDRVPMQRWAKLDEVGEAIYFLLAGPNYITGEIIHLDGGRHLL